MIGGYNGTLINGAGFSATKAPIVPTATSGGVMVHGGQLNPARCSCRPPRPSA